ncbi:MAG: universal stress protein [Saprospiraceae bacterium]|nr:universal stress protein [Saprospiraceae bacterium]
MKTIITPTDFSNNANNALRYANAFAQTIRGKIKMLNVYTPTVGKYNMIRGIIAEETALAVEAGYKQMEKISKKYVTVPCTTIMETGDPLDEINSSAVNNKGDIIILGTHGVTNVQEAVFGSTTAKVISHSTLPVLAIPQRYKYKKINKIVYATDLNNAVNELKLLIPIAKSLNATIEVLFMDYGWNEHEAQKKALNKKIKAFSYKKIKYAEVEATIEKTLIDQIENFIKKTKPEVLAMFPTERSWINKIFNSSKTEDLIYKLKIPLLSIKK